MTSWRQIGAQIGGANAVTWWAWLISLPISVLISSVYVIEPTLQDVAEWTAALIGIHIILKWKVNCLCN